MSISAPHTSGRCEREGSAMEVVPERQKALEAVGLSEQDAHADS